jgi:cytochrome c biogenesis factor
MALFGSFALLIALALAAYNLLAGALALRLIATGQPRRISPERLADTARRAGIAGFVAVTAAAFALIWSVFTNDFSITYIWSTRTGHCRGRTSFPRSGAGRKVRCCFGRGCWGFTALCCG